jgi:4-amino-4-deoxy-L-arabinose transferase-like glycosyltransferase
MEATQGGGARLWREVTPWVAAALLFRLFFLLAMPRVIDTADGILYIELAEKFAAGDIFAYHPRLPVLFSALGAIAHFVIPDMEWACRSVSFIASVLLVVPVYLLSRQFHGKPAARMAALAVVISPWLADYGCRVGLEALSTTLWFAAVYALARALREGRAWLLLAPLAFFALHLARPEGTVLLLAAPLGAVFLCAKSEDAKYARLVPYVLICGVLLGLYALYSREALGVATINTRISSSNLSVFAFVVNQSGAIVRAFLKVTGEVIPIMVGPYLLLFVGVGLFRPSKEARDFRLEFFLLYFCALQGACAALSTYPAPRYLMPVIVAAYFWGGRGIALVAAQCEGFPRAKWLRHLPVAGMILIMSLGTATTVLAEHAGRLPREPREYKMAGRWMKENLEPGLILSRKPQVGFYAGMDTTGPAVDDSTERLIERAKEVGARYLVVDERNSTKMVPGLVPLLEPANAPPALRLLKSDLSPYSQGRIVIYEVLNPKSPDKRQRKRGLSPANPPTADETEL